MRCTKCQANNPEDSRFCEACGTPLDRACPSCGASNRASANFCRQCGTALVAPSRELKVESQRPSTGTLANPRTGSPANYTPKHLADKILQSKSALEGERKQVTVLFADVKGSMRLSEQVDAEEWHRILDRFFTILSAGVHRFEGTVNQYTGDGIMALFGAPIAHEDHAQRACYAALHLREELRRYADELRRSQGVSFLVRIGINSGEVVVGKIGDDLRMDYTAQGHTVGLAARMEQLAEPGKPLLTENTAQLIRGYFRLHDLGAANVKGVSAALQLYELEDVGDLRTRFDVSRSRGLTRFVGRDDEMQVLEGALEHTLRSGGRVVAIVADAGTGKSRLCFEFAQSCRVRGIEVNEAVCVAHGRTIPLLPLVEHFRQVFGIRNRDRPEIVRQKIAGALTLLDTELRDTLPLWFDFFGAPDPTRPLPRMDPDRRQRKFVGAIKRLMRARGQTAPGVLVFEDLQWADSASEALLQSLIEVLSETRTLLVLNYRPEYRAAWTQVALEAPATAEDAFLRVIHLDPLRTPAVRQLVDDLIGGDPSLDDLRGLVHERTGGNPFFIEEVIRSLYSQGILVNDAATGTRPKGRLTRALREIQIPASVRAVLAARIDRLSAAQKHVLQTAAVIGKEFSEPILRHVASNDGFEADLTMALGELVASEFLWEKSLYPEAEYAFRHPLTHHVAYHAQLRDRRVRVHGAIARALIAANPQEVNVRAAVIAHHWEGADELLEAARWSRKAAEWLTRSDPSEAQRHWRKVRELTLALPGSAERDELVIDASTELIKLGVRMGIGETDAREVFDSARALGEARQDRRALAQLHNAYGMCCGMSGLVDTAVEHIMEAERYAAQIDDHEIQLGLRVTVAVWLLHRGQLSDAMELIEQGIALAEGDVSFGADIVGFSPLIFLTLYRGTTLATLGNLDAARTDMARALKLARRHDEADLECLTLGFLAIVAFYDGDADAVLSFARQTMQVATRLGSPFMLGYANGILGSAHRMREEWDEAVSVLKAELTITRERRTGLLVEAVSIANLSEAYLGKGEMENALRTAEEAVAVARARGSLIFECDALLAQVDALLRIHGEKARDEIQALIDTAHRIATETGAGSRLPLVWERRAALARACNDQEGWEDSLRQALRCYSAIGAKGHVARISRALA